tara:strand:+ start:231 stop:383 length:153 start_codon:yes stop_codon:yes gene_type:complete
LSKRRGDNTMLEQETYIMTEQEMENLINDAFGATFWKYLAFVWSGLEEDY